MKINKNSLFSFILGAVLFGSIGVAASQLFAKDISFTPTNPNWVLEENTVEKAIEDLYNRSNDIDGYNNKPYTQDGLVLYENRVTILSGGYYTDSNNITWVNLRLRTNRSLSGNDFWKLIHNLPSSNKSVAFTDTNNKYTFKFNPSGSSYPSGTIIFMDYSSTDLPANEEFTIQFKY